MEPNVRHFDGIGEVTISLLPALKAQLLWVRIARIVGPPMARIIQALERDKLAQLAEGNPAGVGGISEAVEILASKMTEAEFDGIRRELLALAHVDGKPLLPVANVLFQGKVLALFKVMWFAIEANYADFSEGVRAAVGTFLAQKARPSESSPKESPALGLVGG